MAWQRWNLVSKRFESSTNEGDTWTPLPVAYTDRINTFTEDQYITKPGPTMRFKDTNSPANTQLWVMGCDQAYLWEIQCRDDAGNVLTRPLIMSRNGEVRVYAGLFEGSRTTMAGHWAGYTPTWVTSSSLTPTVGASGSITGKYTIIGKTVFFHITFSTQSTTVCDSGIFGFSIPVPSNLPINGSIIIYNGVSGVNWAGSLYSGSQLHGGNLAGRVGASISVSGSGSWMAGTVPFNWNGTPSVVFIGGSYEMA